MSNDSFEYVMPTFLGIDLVNLSLIAYAIVALSVLGVTVNIFLKRRRMKPWLIIGFSALVVALLIFASFNNSLNAQKDSWNEKQVEAFNSYYGTTLDAAQYASVKPSDLDSKAMNYGAPFAETSHEDSTEVQFYVMGAQDNNLYLFEMIGAELAPVRPVA